MSIILKSVNPFLQLFLEIKLNSFSLFRNFLGCMKVLILKTDYFCIILMGKDLFKMSYICDQEVRRYILTEKTPPTIDSNN